MPETRPDPRPFWRKPRFQRFLLGLALANVVIYGAVTYRLATKQERLTQQRASLSQEIASQQEELSALQKEQERIARNGFNGGRMLRVPKPGVGRMRKIRSDAWKNHKWRGRPGYALRPEDISNDD